MLSQILFLSSKKEKKKNKNEGGKKEKLKRYGVTSGLHNALHEKFFFFRLKFYLRKILRSCIDFNVS